MSDSVRDFAGVMVILIGSITALAIIGLVSVRVFVQARRAPQLQPPRFDEQFAQLQQSLDAMALEIERIAESQRFSTKLLAESSRDRALAESR
ncbi:MAG: hypothetical protein M3R65_09135 [Gemmatimonadota bacterium]|nr:hypothetical protein [Gemmatimonadota bacterium]